MVILSDREIRKSLATKEIVIEGMEESQIGPCSVDLRLGNKFRVSKGHEVPHIDPRNGIPDDFMELVEKNPGDSFVIHPGEFVLGMTHESIKLPRALVGRLDGRSSWGRLGIVIHSTAGSVQPGWEGKLTLEISNISQVPVVLTPGCRICQISFETLSSPAENIKSSGKYVKQDSPGVSKITHEVVSSPYSS
jgi:dCTP deaminase